MRIHQGIEKLKIYAIEIFNRMKSWTPTCLRTRGIVSQLTPPGTPQRNGVSERRNHTLLDMVRSIMSPTDLPLLFWGHALETAAFTLNRAPSKSIEMTPYELWFGNKPKLSFLKVWGCDVYV